MNIEIVLFYNGKNVAGCEIFVERDSITKDMLYRMCNMLTQCWDNAVVMLNTVRSRNYIEMTKDSNICIKHFMSYGGKLVK